jgi:hypothetical protein
MSESCALTYNHARYSSYSEKELPVFTHRAWKLYVSKVQQIGFFSWTNKDHLSACCSVAKATNASTNTKPEPSPELTNHNKNQNSRDKQ